MFTFTVMLENGPKCEWHNYRSIYLNWDLVAKKVTILFSKLLVVLCKLVNSLYFETQEQYNNMDKAMNFLYLVPGSFRIMEIIILPCQHTCDKDPLPKAHSKKDLDNLKDAGELREGLVRTQQWRDTYVEMILSSDFTEK